MQNDYMTEKILNLLLIIKLKKKENEKIIINN